MSKERLDEIHKKLIEATALYDKKRKEADELYVSIETLNTEAYNLMKKLFNQ